MDPHEQPPRKTTSRRHVDVASMPAVTRRGFLTTMGLSGAAAAVGHTAHVAIGAMHDGADSAGPTTIGPDPTPIRLTVNGTASDITVEPSTTLLEALRTHLNLTGAKEVCDRAACGACSVLVDGRLVTSCMMLAVDAIGCEVTTVEGLAPEGELTTLQQSFIRHDALQCGFCTPGLVVAGTAVLARHPRPTMTQIRRGLAGNICRCGTYTNVFNAMLEASGQRVPTDSPIDGADTP